jgi:hypothetical protein
VEVILLSHIPKGKIMEYIIIQLAFALVAYGFIGWIAYMIYLSIKG